MSKGRSNGKKKKEEDTQAIAGFLLSLKHRSVTPENCPNDSQQHPATAAAPPPPQQPRAPTHRALPPPVVNHAYPPSYYAPPPPPRFHYAHPPVPPPERQPQPPQAYIENSAQLAISRENNPTHDMDMPWESLLGDSKLVYVKDRDLVPDSLFVAMAQMKPCRLQHADRVGCYKSREIGFVGMCCKHCGGQPGFGRFYPNSVRSLAQTTTSQTILKHIGSKCRFCPAHVRSAVLELQRQQAVREGLPSGRPRYGSRKIFFQRVWQRLHGGKVQKDLDEEERSAPFLPPARAKTPPSELDMTSMESNSDDDFTESSTAPYETHAVPRVNHRYGVLPARANKRVKYSEYPHPPVPSYTAE